MKKITLVLGLLLSLASSMEAKSILFTLKNGTKVYYLLGGEKNPVMKVVDGQVMVNDDVLEISDVKNFILSNTDDPDAVSEVKLPQPLLKGNRFVFGEAEGEVRVYNLSGMEVKAKVEKADEYVSVDVSTLAKGTYIIKIGDNAFKVTKK